MYKYTIIQAFGINPNFCLMQFVCACMLSNVTKNEYLYSPKG